MAKPIQKLLAVTTIASSLLLGIASHAQADDDGGLNFSLGVGVPGLSAQVSNYPPTYYASPGYYYAPPPPPPPPVVVYGPPAPVYYAPPPPRRGPPPWAGVWRH